ncbi:hypothetical protein COHA_001885 [Chlorella ohadii]|uniref:Uncharacterized protein n=1 Tax=Chlorella ohadii TaxID=2649997 RepID=A0AAD5DVN9_9CHLO|nr:hypothetical protein COHA_001885 [Chlorella ohadii]
MEQQQKTRLALHLMNCQLQVQGSGTYPCRPRQTLRECIEVLPDRAHGLYVEYLTHADTMCLFIQNQNFERNTENMLNQLAEGSKFAKSQLDAMSGDVGRLAGTAAELAGKAEATLGLLHEHRELEEESLALAKKARAEAAAYFQTLDAKQQLGLELQESTLANQAKLEAGQAATLAQLSEAQAEAQRKLAGELTGLVDSSKGIRSAVDVVINYQQRSDSVLMRLLGKSYTLEDAAFYAVGVLAAWAAGISPATAKARLPVVALMGVSLLGERLLVDRLHMWLEVDGQDQLLVNLPLPGWLPAALLPASLVPGTAATAASTSLLQLNLKWAVRRAALAIGAAMLLYAFFTHRDYERESYKLLRQLEEEQRRRHEEYLELVRRQKIELAAMLGGAAAGGSSGEHSPPGAAALRGGRRAGAAAAIAAPQWVEQPSRQQQGAAQQRQLMALAGARGKLPSVKEEDEEWEDDPQEQHAAVEHSLQQQASVRPPAAAAGRRAAARPAAVTPAAKERPKVAAAPVGPRSAMMRRVAAAAPTKSGSRKRGPSEDAEATGAPAGKQRAVGRRRGIHTEETEAAGEDDSLAAGTTGQAAAAGAGSKRGRRGSADQVAAPKRTRRS